MKFLFYLTRVFRFFDANDRFPKVKFQKSPNISNARWNSKKIQTLFAFILFPMKRNSLLYICKFIYLEWTDLWFCGQMNNAGAYDNLLIILQGHQKVLNTVKRFWKPERSKLHIPRSNRCAERAIIKCFQDVCHRL